MGCFLACFGFSNKRNRRRPAYKRHGSYEPLDSPIALLSLDNAEPEPRHKPKDQLSSKIRKKVSFNLNVQIYEPISTDYHFLSDQENDVKTIQKGNEERAQGSLSSSLQPLSEGSSNLNYRYQNCRDFYDEEDDIAFEDSDLDDYEDDYDFVDDNGDSDVDSQRESQDGTLKKKVSSDELIEETGKSHYTHSVLKPVENLNQWRAAKAKEAAPAKQHNQMKENISLLQEAEIPGNVSNCNRSKPLLQETPVQSSLSSWLNSSST